MSRFYKPLDSRYLMDTSKSLKSHRELHSAVPEEIFACAPEQCNTMQDTRTSQELENVIDTDKLWKVMRNIDSSHPKNIWFVICSGSFAPIHLSHLQMAENALDQLTKTDSLAVMAYFIPNHASYTELKIKKRGKTPPKVI